MAGRPIRLRRCLPHRRAPCWENTGHRIYTCVLQDLGERLTGLMTLIGGGVAVYRPRPNLIHPLLRLLPFNPNSGKRPGTVRAQRGALDAPLSQGPDPADAGGAWALS